MNCKKIKSLYPTTKLYISLLFIVLTLLATSLVSKVVVFGLLLLLAYISGVGSSFIKKLFSSLGVLFIILLIIQSLFHPSEKILFSFGIINIKYEGLIFALKLGLSLMSMGGSIILYFLVTSEKDFVISLQKAGMSNVASYVIFSTLQMVPTLKKKSEVIMNAQKARGVETEGGLFTRMKVFIPTLIPLVLSSITGTEQRALTLEARGFLSNKKPSYLNDIKKTNVDVKITRLLIALILLAIVGRIIIWLI